MQEEVEEEVEEAEYGRCTDDDIEEEEEGKEEGKEEEEEDTEVKCSERGGGNDGLIFITNAVSSLIFERCSALESREEANSSSLLK